MNSPQLESMLKLVSPRVGLIRSLTRVARDADEPNPPVIYRALLSHFNFRRAVDLERAAGGKGETEQQAMLSAIGEALERYCAYHPPESAFLRATFLDLHPQAVSPPDFVLYSENQYARPGFPYARFLPWQELSWMRGHSLPEGDDVWLPASMIYLNYFGDQPQDYICPSTSNGLAAGPDLKSAILGGLYEIVERDALLINWMNRLPAPRLSAGELDGLPRSIIDHYRRSGTEVILFDLTTDIPIPVAMAIAVDHTGRGPAALIGLGCDLDPHKAIRKALLELCQVRPGEAARFAQTPESDRLREYHEVRTLTDHSAFFTFRENFAELAFLLDHKKVRSIDEMTNRGFGEADRDLAIALEIIECAGYRAFYVDITTPDLAGLELKVVRVLITGLQPIHFGFGEERLGGRRLFEVAGILGIDDHPRTEAELNYCPHPLG